MLERFIEAESILCVGIHGTVKVGLDRKSFHPRNEGSNLPKILGNRLKKYFDFQFPTNRLVQVVLESDRTDEKRLENRSLIDPDAYKNRTNG
jgi:hypothetical protein